MDVSYDLIVLGAGHAGVEAAHAAARLGLRTALVTMQPERCALMSCNPAIGGLAKGQLVREIDALGGVMARAIDATGIQFRMLNLSKGLAVRAPRAQADKMAYSRWVTQFLQALPNLTLIEGVGREILTNDSRVCGLRLGDGRRLAARVVICTTGTFLDGLIHIGLHSFPAGRAGEPSAVGLSASFRALGLETARLKTGTPARLDRQSIDWERLAVQRGDDPPQPFSFETARIDRPSIPCHLTYTNERTHAIIRDGLDRSPLYSGVIQSIGPRYCPSIEDKVVRFAERERHQIFLEPEGVAAREIYPNGISTSLPEDVQRAFIHSIAGLERARILRLGYAIEYTFCPPRQLLPTLEVRAVPGLYLAGQINATSGYEEAAAQGLMAGINAALSLRDEAPLVLMRHEAYIGVLIDDLITRDHAEPYRMFSSRAEHRLALRHDNADLRLTDHGRRVGMIGDERYERFCAYRDHLEAEIARLAAIRPERARLAPVLERRGLAMPENLPLLSELLARPGMDWSVVEELGLARSTDTDEHGPTQTNTDNGSAECRMQSAECIGDVRVRPCSSVSVCVLSPPLDPRTAEQIYLHFRYAGYLHKEAKQVERLRRLEEKRIPAPFDFRAVHGLRKEAADKLARFHPATLGAASRIAGVTPADVGLVLIALRANKQAGD